MAFRFTCDLPGYEYRGMRTGVGGNGRQWMSLVTESPDDASQLDVSVPVELQDEVFKLALRKGFLLNMRVLCVAAEKYSFVRLVDIPTVFTSDGEVL